VVPLQELLTYQESPFDLLLSLNCPSTFKTLFDFEIAFQLEIKDKIELIRSIKQETIIAVAGVRDD
jgi:hypothetical protein